MVHRALGSAESWHAAAAADSVLMLEEVYVLATLVRVEIIHTLSQQAALRRSGLFIKAMEKFPRVPLAT